MTTPPPRSDKPKSPVPVRNEREGLLVNIMSSLKLKFRLLRDRRVSGWMKLAFFGGLIWFVFPDLVAGPLDDIVVLAMLANWEDLLPEWLVNEHRLRLEAENRGEYVDTQPPSPPPPPRQPEPAPPTQPTPPPPTVTVPADSHRYVVVIHRAEGISVFHLTRRTKDAIEGNNDLKKALNRYRITWDTDHQFMVGTKREAQVIKVLTDHLKGLRIQTPT